MEIFLESPPKSDSSIPRPPINVRLDELTISRNYRGVFDDVATLTKDIAKSDSFKVLGTLFALLIGVLIVNMFGQVELNEWQGSFYRAIEKKNVRDILHEVLYFAGLISVLLTAVVSQTWLIERLKIHLRKWLVNHLLDGWLQPSRAYQLSMSSDDGVNPDQRIQEDVRNFSEMSADLAAGLLQACLLLCSFIGVLWIMSDKISFTYESHKFIVPGYMVWIAITYAAIGSWLAARVGRPLVRLNEERYSREANLRFAIVRVSESSESVAFHSGEKDERRIINDGLTRIFTTLSQLSFAHARLTWVTSGYGWIIIVLPVLVALPGFIQGSLDLGGLMMVVGAFNQVQQSLRWFVDNFSKIADWRAALHRVVVFRNAVIAVARKQAESTHIILKPHDEGHLKFDQLKIHLSDGAVVIADATAHILPGDRVMICGESGSGKSTLFRAAAGLWPWGAGTIELPNKADTIFLPQRPYFPLGTLAQAIAYPLECDSWTLEEFEDSLRRLNLSDFIPMLYVEDRWDKIMSLGQQQRLAFARLLLHRPKWIFLDEATSALDDENQDRAMSIFLNELKDSSILSIGHRSGLAKFHNRTLDLKITKAGTILGFRSAITEKRKALQKLVEKYARGTQAEQDPAGSASLS